MDRQTGGSETAIYVIDRDHRIVHFNRALGEIFPELRLGQSCYRALCREEGPCPGCPLHGGQGEGTVFYNKWLRRWVEVSTGKLEWPGKGECDIVLAREIQEDNKGLFYGLTSLSVYDELFELDLGEDRYRILYHEGDKYLLPALEGRLTHLVGEASEGMVHPDDRAAFLRFWSLEDLLERLAGEGSIKGEFRKHCTDGGWRWVLQTVVPLRRAAGEGQIVLCFVQDIDSQKRRELEEATAALAPAVVDPLTGLYNRAAFFAAADGAVAAGSGSPLCVVAVDIEHFKLFNEWHGRSVGDDFLAAVAACLRALATDRGGIAGYMGDDDFCLLLPDAPEALDELETRVSEVARSRGGNAGFLPAFGVCGVEDPALPVRTLYDRAALALASVKGNYARRLCRYGAGMMRQMEEEHHLLSEVQRGLERGEFTFYLQPKCNMKTGKIVGFESLVRWQHPQRGLVAPGAFLPLMEKNGFIANLDRPLWEGVCAKMREWLDRGFRPVPVSVNVSRVDLYTMDVAACFQQLVERYRLDPHLIAIEITESAYAEEFDIITEAVSRLRQAGFTVLMDDFGSGYSSLNMLKDVNVDVLKIDMKFLEMREQSAGKGSGILEAIVGMARLMGLRVVAEGVETPEQAGFLLEIGCQYGQGYHFARPMPIAEAEALLADEGNFDYRGIHTKRMGMLQIRELLNENLFSEILLNNILGGIAFYDVCGDQVEPMQVNEQYYRVTGTTPEGMEERRGRTMESVYSEDREVALDIFRRAHASPLNGAEGDFRYLTEEGDTIWLHLRTFFLREQLGHRLYYGSVSDVSEQKRQEEQLASSQQALSAVVGVAENDESFMQLAEENRRAAASIFAQMSPGGMIGGYCEEGFPLYFANREMVRLLGYDSYDEFAAAIGHRVQNTIHPDDLAAVTRDIGPRYYPGLEYTTTYRMPRKDGSWFWTLDKGRVIEAEDGRLAIVSACTDISQTMAAQQRLAERNAFLLEQNRELDFLNHALPGAYHRCDDDPGYSFLYISDQFLEMFGFTREEIGERFDNQFLEMVHPDDRALVQMGGDNLQREGMGRSMEYRMCGKDGYRWVIDQSRYMEYEGKRFFQGMVVDITETVELRDKMRLLMAHTPENIFLLKVRGERERVRVIADGLFRDLGGRPGQFEEMLRTRRYEGYLAPGDWQRLRGEMVAAVAARGEFHQVARLDLPSGRRAWVSLDGRCIEQGEGEVTYLCTNRDVTTVKEKERELWLAGQKLSSILRQAGIDSWDWDLRTGALTFSTTCGRAVIERILGRPVAGEDQRVAGFAGRLLAHPGLPEGHRERIAAYLRSFEGGRDRERFACEFPVTGADGELCWLHTAGETICDGEGRPARAVGYYRDITREKNESLKSREDRKILELLRGQAVYDFRANLQQNTVSVGKDGRAWRTDTGYRGGSCFEELLDHVGRQLVLPSFRKEFAAFCDRERLLECYRQGQQLASMDYQRLYRGQANWMRLMVHLAELEGSPDVFAYLFVMDIDRQKRQELKLTQLAEIDALTGLYNRRAAIPKIEEYLAAQREESAALLMFDLDNFKLANDVFGHAYGDSMIAQNAERLRGFFRGEDILCRVGGDEFLVLCKNIREEDVIRKLDAVVRSMVVSYKAQDHTIVFSISAGFAMAPEQGRTFDELYQKADMALFSAKMGGKNAFYKYHSDMKSVRYELAGKGMPPTPRGELDGAPESAG
ncbi:EAL domain-containing protein [Bittarella massiliensis (ex Durand et al. 2017)]|uniref:EAL domain-containing protein n=1 Tax=Bittarella massiliensis (ex Durand et al. 2017) TaxID=1720313 RepID=UPI001FAE73B8|nr:EAL domain-containing protein [Bittarella massiliensis (ex Durand et al. 2017)]